MKRFVLFPLVGLVTCLSLGQAQAAPSAPPLTAIRHVALVIGPPFDGHKIVDLLFATSTPLTKQKDTEGTLRFPGGAGVNSTAYAEIFAYRPSAKTKSTRCYIAEAPITIGRHAKPGQLLHGTVVLSNKVGAPRLHRDLRVRQATETQVAKQFGC